MKKAICIVALALLLAACGRLKEGEPPDQKQAQKALVEAMSKADIDAMKKAFSQGADPNTPDENGTLPLFFAIGYVKKEDVVEALLEAGAKTEPAGEQLTPLHVAAFWGDLETAKILLDAGAKVDGTGDDDFTPLCQAIVMGHAEFVKFSLENDANFHVKNKDGATLLHRAAGTTDAAWRGDAQEARAEIARNLISRGLDPHATDKKGRTPLHYAVQSGQVELARLLLEKGLNPDEQDREGLTPLHLAAQNDCYFSIEFLMTQRANINTPDNCGRTPLDHAKSKSTKGQLRSYSAVSGEELKKREGK
jgi:ankyrin repeat protein